MITVYYNGKPYQYADSTKYLELARTLQPQFEHDIVLASVNGKLQELWKYIKDGASVSFLTTQSQAGIMAYRRSVVLLLLKALNILKLNQLFDHKKILFQRSALAAIR